MVQQMNNLYIITLEKIEQRYTKQWYYYWNEAFGKYFNVHYIDGPKLSDKIDKGRFLDINKTNLWKAEQVKKLSKLFMNNKIVNGDSFLFMDAWHYGITALKYMIDLQKFKCKIYGYWHAGSYDPADFVAQAGLGKWCNYNELGWLNALDKSFVATKFHKELLTTNLRAPSNKIKVIGFPMDWEKEISSKIKSKNNKENIVVFPHRLDKEKNPQVFDKISKQHKQYKFIKTLLVTKTKRDYYTLLQKSKVVFSASTQETFGIGTVEALFLNNVPVVPNKLSYKELYNKEFRYDTIKEASEKVKYFIDNYDTPKVQKLIKDNKAKIQTLCLSSISNMAKVMLK
jgi:glycosyltransferase involved in cell wall biosynthesis